MASPLVASSLKKEVDKLEQKIDALAKKQDKK